MVVKVGPMEIVTVLHSMHYPILLLLIMLTFQIARSLYNKPYYFVGIGWCANLIAVVLSNTFGLASDDQGTVPTSWVLDAQYLLLAVTAYSFWLAGRRESDMPHALTLDRVSDSTIALLVLVCFLLSIVSGNYETPLNLIFSYSVLILGFLFKSSFRTVGKGWARLVFLMLIGHAALLCLYSLNLLAYIPVDPPWQWEPSIFLWGLLTKTTILLTMLSFLVEKTKKMSKEKAEIWASRRTLGRLAHELGTPFAEITVHLATLQKVYWRNGESAASPSRMVLSFERIAEAVERMRATLQAAESLLPGVNRFSEAVDRGESRQKIVSINKLIQSAIMIVKDTRDENVKFRISYQANCTISCVETDIKRIMINLLNNSLDAMPEGSGTISVATRKESPSRTQSSSETVTVLIIDDGEGVAPRHINVVFKEGFTTRSGTGRGIGLALVSDLLRKNGGTIQLTSNLTASNESKRGTTVILSFPFAAESDLP